MSIFLVVFMYAAWSSIFSFGKIALEHSTPLFLTATRMMLAGAVLLIYLFIRNKRSLKISLKQLLPILLLAVFSIYLTNICEFWGLQHLTAAKTCFIYSLSPFFAVILSYIHFKEKVNKKKLMGLLIGFIGFLPVLTIHAGDEGLFEAFSILTWPELAIMAAAFFSVYGWVLLRILVKKETISPLLANGSSMLLGGSFALIHSLCIDSWSPIPIQTGYVSSFVGGIVVMTLISNILCYNLYGYMLKKYTATFLSFMGLLSPIFASLNSWIFLGERPSLIIFASTAVVSFGLWIVYQAELKQGYIATKPKETLTEA